MTFSRDMQYTVPEACRAVSGYFGRKTLRHRIDEKSGHFGPGSEVSGHFGTYFVSCGRSVRLPAGQQLDGERSGWSTADTHDLMRMMMMMMMLITSLDQLKVSPQRPACRHYRLSQYLLLAAEAVFSKTELTGASCLHTEEYR